MSFVLNAIQSYCNHETALKILGYLCIGNLISHRKPVSDWNVYKNTIHTYQQFLQVYLIQLKHVNNSEKFRTNFIL